MDDWTLQVELVRRQVLAAVVRLAEALVLALVATPTSTLKRRHDVTRNEQIADVSSGNCCTFFMM